MSKSVFTLPGLGVDLRVAHGSRDTLLLRDLQWANPLDESSWDRRVSRCEGATFFHGSAWARVLHATYGFTPLYLLHESDSRIRGLLPLMEVDSWLTGRRGVGLPFTDECAPLGADTQTVDRLVTQAIALGTLRGWKHCEWRGRPEQPGAPAAASFYGHRLDLQTNVEQQFAACAPAARQAVRKAESAGLKVRLTQSLEATRTFYRLLAGTRRRHGVPPPPWALFANIHQHILARQLGFIVLAQAAGRPVAGAVFFHFGRSAVFKFGASDEAFLHLRPNNLVMWKAISWHARAGFTTLDFGRTETDNAGLRQFKLRWGATERRITYARFDCRRRMYVTAPDRTTGWPRRLFRFVPRPLARVFGTLAYPHIA